MHVFDRTPEAVDALVADAAPRVLEGIRLAARGRNEAEFREDFYRTLADFANSVGLPLDRRAEYVLAKGRADAAYNRLVIEYERPGSLSQTPGHRHTRHAIDQVRQYIDGVAKREGLAARRLMGVATDGSYFVFVRKWDTGWEEDPPVAIDVHQTRRFLRLLVSMATGHALLAENLVEEFGAGSGFARLLGLELYRALGAELDDSRERLTHKLFAQWRTFFGEATAFESLGARASADAAVKSFAEGLGVSGKVDVARLLFVAHTYYALLIKLIAYLALATHVGPLGVRFGRLVSLSDEELLKQLRSLESGGLFRQAGFRNFLEGDFFGWYLDAWNLPLATAVRKVVERLREYDPATSSVNPEATRDLLKQLYQYLMPRAIRHRLGEYYTPDWLATRLLGRSGFLDNPRQRVLDPACGSGTFLVLAIREMRRACERSGLNERETLREILANVAGIDLNPLAVVTARTNYFLALGPDLLAHRDDEMEIPVYLADSVLPPSPGSTLFGQDRYSLGTAVGAFSIPSALKSRDDIQQLASLLDQAVEDDVEPPVFLERAKARLSLPEARWNGTDGFGPPASEPLDESYRLLRSLHKEGLDGLWAQIMKNAFMPLFLGKFDLVVGNPPWIGWENLPSEYRTRLEVLRDKFSLAARAGGSRRPRLGAVKLDLAYLMTYAAADRYLEDGGILAFVITQTAFKSLGAAEGFRRFVLPDTTPLRVVGAEDLTDLQPFEAASNRTATIVIRRGEETRYPVPYLRWARTGRTRTPRSTATLPDVLQMVRVLNHVAVPVSPRDAASPWLTGTKETIAVARRVVGGGDYSAHLGANTGGANGIFWVIPIEDPRAELVLVRNEASAAKRGEEEYSARIEAARLHPLLKMSDIARWWTEPSGHIVEAQSATHRARALDPQTLQTEFPKTWAWYHHFEDSLRRRSGWTQILEPSNSEFYGLMDVGDYTFLSPKVVWPKIARRVEAAVVEGDVIPQDTVIFIQAKTLDEADYLAALLNSSAFNLAAVSYSQSGGKSFGSPHLVQTLRLPEFNPRDDGHVLLAQLGSQARRAASGGRDVAHIEARVDRAALDIWGIDAGLLPYIEGALAEALSGVGTDSPSTEDQPVGTG